MNDDRLDRAIQVLRLDSRDADGWELLYRAVYPLLFGSAFRSLHGNRFLAEECTQEVMLRALRNLDFTSETTPASLIAYLRQTTRSVLVDAIRRERKFSDTTELGTNELDLLQDSSFSQGEMLSEMHVRLAQALTMLNLRESDIVTFLASGGSINELAERLKLSKQRTYQVASDARKKFREILFPSTENNQAVRRIPY